MKILKAIKNIWNIITTVAVVVIVVFAVMLVGVRLLGMQVYAVASGSMEPEYPVGSLIYVKQVDPSSIKTGDVITYVLPSDIPSTHRVIDIESQADGSFLYYTKGDANNTADLDPVHSNNLIGVPVFKLPLLGYVANYIQNPPGKYVAFGVCAVLIIFVFLPDFFGSDKKNKSEKS